MSILQKELEFYNDNKEEWIETGLEHKFVLIKYLPATGGQREGWNYKFFDKDASAYEFGIDKYGNVPILIKQILEIEPIHRI